MTPTPTHTPTDYETALHEHLEVEHQIGQAPEALEGLDRIALEALHAERHPLSGPSAADHEHERDDFDPRFVHCPSCGTVDLKTAEEVPALSRCTITLGPPGQDPEIEWTDTDYCDGSESVVDDQGRIELWCPNCGVPFWDDRVRRPGFKPDPAAAQVAAAVALRAELGRWLNEVAVPSGLRDQAVGELAALLTRYDSGAPGARVIVRVEGGIAEVAEKPEYLEVIVLDLDDDAEEPVVVNRHLAGDAIEADSEVLALISDQAGPDE